MAFDPSRLSGKNLLSLRDAIEKSVCEDSLYDFLRKAWPAFDPAPFVGGWHLGCIAEHLSAVTNGQIKRLLINVRPRSGKTSLVAVAWPVWTWALEPDPNRPLRGPGVRFLCGSYGASKAQEDAVTARRLISSEWFQRLWGNRCRISKDRDNAERYDTLAGGSRISTGIPESLGKGGMVKLLDDPQKSNEVESERVSEQVVRNYREIWQTRSNDPTNSAEVMVMQRQGECLLPGVQVRTLDGQRPIEEISPGDIILGSAGWQQALATKQSDYSGAAFGIRLYGHPEICWTTANHLYKTKRGWVPADQIQRTDWVAFKASPERQYSVPWPKPRMAPPPRNHTGNFRGKFERWRHPSVEKERLVEMAGSGMTNSAIGIALGVHRNTVHNYMRHYGIERVIEHNALEGRDHLSDPRFWRMVGYWLAEGSFAGDRDETPSGIVFSFGAHEHRIVKDAEDVFGSYGLRVMTSFAKASVAQVSVHSSALGVWMETYFGSGAYGKTIPEFVFSLDPQCRKSMLNGWMAGDGCIRSKTGQVAGSSVNWAILHGFQRLALSLDIECGLMKKHGPSNSILNHPTRGPLQVRSTGIGGELRLAKSTWNKSRVRCRVEDGSAWYQVRKIETKWHDGPVYDIQTPSQDFVVGNATVHNSDLSGFWLENFADDVVHVCLPAWHESDRVCQTFIDMSGRIYSTPPRNVDVDVFWEDPREYDGESFWPQRYPPQERARDEALGDFPFAGQIQQRPEPRGGGIIKRMWWQAWPPDDAIEQWLVEGQVSYPPWELQVAYLDTAFTKKETNDYCAMTRWGVFGNSAGTPCAMLCGAWQERHSFGELIEHVKKSVRLWKTDILIIENKAGGIWVRDELLTQLEAGELTIVLDTPVVDKVSRAHAVVPLFTGSLVYAPFMHDKGVWRVWAEMVISNVEKFPTGRHDDIVDTCTGALGYLRRNDLIKLKQEAEEEERESRRFKGNQQTIAEEYGIA